MSRPMVDLTSRRALRRDVRALVEAHPELCSPDARERCAAWLEGEEPDDAIDTADTAPREVPNDEHATNDAHATNDGRRPTRPASRGD